MEPNPTAEHAKSLGDILAWIATRRDPVAVVARVVRIAARLCNAPIGLLLRLGPTGEDLEVVAACGVGRALLGTRVPVRGTLNGLVISSARTVWSMDALSDPRLRLKTVPLMSGARGIAIVPLRREGGPFGTLAVGSRVPQRFDEAERTLLARFADGASIAIQTAELRARHELPAAAAEARVALALQDAPPAPAESDGRREGHLTPRERQIVQLLVEGRTYKEVAAELGISSRTVEHYLERLKQRLGQPRLHALLTYVVLSGLLERPAV